MKKNGPEFEAIGFESASGDSTENQENFIEFRTRPFDWWPWLVELFGGPDHGLSIGVRIDAGFELVEIIGPLPRPLRKGLRRYAPWNDNDYAIEWAVRPDGCGPRYELHSMNDLLDRLAERKVFLGAAGGK